jgi:hypothetical protein
VVPGECFASLAARGDCSRYAATERAQAAD